MDERFDYINRGAPQKYSLVANTRGDYHWLVPDKI